MIAKREVWNYPHSAKVWAGKYRHSHNLLHWHYDCELLYVEKGSIDVFCEKQTHTLTVGEALYIDRGQVHYMHAREEDTTLIVLVFDYAILKDYLGDVRLAVPRLKGNYPIPETYAKIREVLLSKEKFCGAEAAAHVLLLMSEIFRGEEVVPREGEDATTRKFIRLLGEVSEKYEYFTFSDAASYMGMSECYFSRYFHRATGITFSRHLNFVRTEHAVELMQSGSLSMTEIATRCGFGTIRNFNRVFREVTGYAPRDLPADFRLGERLPTLAGTAFNPTLYDCELLESVQG